MLMLPKVKKVNPGLSATKKVKSIVASVLTALAVAVSAPQASAAMLEDVAVFEMSEHVQQYVPLTMLQHDRDSSESAYHSSHSSHFSHSSHRSHFSHYSSRF